MALSTLEIGTAPNDGTGDTLRSGGNKINNNFSEIYTLLGTGTALSSGLSATATVISLAGPTITGVASFADGSASAPSITNTGDSNTGIFFGSADQVDISTGGTARVTVSTTAVTSTVGIVIPDAGNIGSASDTDAIAISSGGDVSLSGGSLSLIDQEKVILGSNSDISLAYDETTTDSLVISSDVNDAALGIVFQADAGADGGDEWKMNFANGGVFTFGNDIASAGTHTTLLTITPNSTAANSTHAFIGKLSASGGITVPNDGDIGSTGATDAMQISSGGIVTFKDDIKIKDGGTIGVASAATAITIASTGIVTLVDDLVLKDACTIGTATTAGAISIAADGTVDLATAGATVNSTVISTVGTQTIWVPACAMRPTVSNGCAVITDAETTSGRPDMQVLDFDASSDEHAQFQICFPKSWNEGTITFSAYWTTTATDTDGVAWGLQGVAVSDNDTIDVAYGTAVVVTDDALSAAEDLCVTATSGAVTIAGTPAVGDICYFRIFRDVSDANDDMAEDARLIGVKIFFTTNAANDA